MEALSILPVKASHQTAKSHGPSGLGDVFAALLQGAANRLDARPADLASFETRRTSGEMPRNDAGFRADNVESDGDAARDRVEAPAPARDHTEIADESEFDAPEPEDGVEPKATAADDDTAEPTDPDIQLAEGEDAEATVPAAQDETDPAPEEIAAPVALPAQAQPVAAVSALAALARAATQSRVPTQAAQQAQTASNTLPAAAARFGIESGAARVQITPAAVVAHPNAALGGGATVAALAAEAGQLAAQNGARNTQASLPNAASQIAATTIAAIGQNLAEPGNRIGRSGPATGNAAGTTQSTSLGQNGNAMANAAQAAVTAVTAVEAAPASGLQSQGQGRPVQGATSTATGAPASPNPHNAQTPFAESNNQNGAGATTPSGLSAAARASEASAQSRLAQNARTDTAQSLGAPVPGADGGASTEGSQRASASRTLTDVTQGARPAALESNHNNTAQTARGDGSAAAGSVGQAAAQNPASGTSAAGERAMAPASTQRAEGAGQANANNPLTAGTLGLTQAAARTPQSLPAQARPATAASLPAHQVAVHIQRAVSAGQDRIRITLHPAELGQIDVKLKVSNDGAVKAIVSIERPETFELLARDARGLEKALQDAGLKTDSGSLSFNLKGESEQDTTARREVTETGSQEAETETPAESELAPEIIAAANANGAGRALDLHV
jgi:flagellar hook-length control protein FliK